MLCACMINDVINNYFNAVLVSFFDQMVESFHCSVFGVDFQIVRYIIFMVRRRLKKWCQPNRIDTQVVQVIKLGCNTVQVADSVTVCVTERTYEYFIAHFRKGGASCYFHWRGNKKVDLEETLAVGAVSQQKCM